MEGGSSNWTLLPPPARRMVQARVWLWLDRRYGMDGGGWGWAGSGCVT